MESSKNLLGDGSISGKSLEWPTKFLWETTLILHTHSGVLGSIKKKKKAYWFVTTVTYHINCSTEILLKMNCLTLFYKESARTHCEGSCYIDFSFSAKVIIATFTRKLWGPVIKSKLRLVRINEQRTCGDEATSIDLCYNSSLPFNSAILGETQQLPAARHRHTDTEPNLYWDKFSVWKPARRYWTDFL